MPPGDYSLAFGKQVNINQQYRTVFYEGLHPGTIGINRDDFDGPILGIITVGTIPGNGNGASLSPNGFWTNASSRETKENFQTPDRDELLGKIAGLPVDSWSYKNSAERHIGPCAEEFASAFGVGTNNPDGSIDNKHISANDVAGVALAGVKGSIQQTGELKAAIQALTEQLSRKSSEIDDLKVQIHKLTELVQLLSAIQGK